MTDGHAKDYDSLVDMLSHIAAWLKPINMEAKTFASSAIINNCLVPSYIHTVKFWAKVSVVHLLSRSTRLFGALKSIRNDYSEECNVLKRVMDDDISLLLANATAEHRQQFDDFHKGFNESKPFLILIFDFWFLIFLILRYRLLSASHFAAANCLSEYLHLGSSDSRIKNSST
jgi:hypothetical protein